MKLIASATESSPGDVTLSRAVTVYTTTGPSFDAALQRPNRLFEEFALGGLREYYVTAEAQMPALLGCVRGRPGAELGLKRESEGLALGAYEVLTVSLFVFALPYPAFVLALSADVSSVDRGGRIQFLRDTTFRKRAVTLSGDPLCQAAAAHVPEAFSILAEHQPALVHQVFREHDPRAYATADALPELPDVEQIEDGVPFAVDDRYIDALVHHTFDPLRAGQSRVCFPPEANEDLRFFTAVTNSTTVLGGERRDLEPAMVLAIAQCTAAATHAAQLRDRAYRELTSFRALSAARPAHQAPSRETLAGISTQISQLRLDLAFSVEAYLDIALVVPHFRIASFHRALVRALGLREGAATIGLLLDQLVTAVDGARASVEHEERNADDASRSLAEDRTRKLSAIGTVVAVFAVPLTLTLGFLGVNASEVDENRSLTSLSHYGLWYLAIAVLCAGAFGAAFAWENRRSSPDGRGAEPGPSEDGGSSTAR